MARNLTVLIVDDHQVVREGLRILITSARDLSIAGEAGDGKAGVRLARRLEPDVVLMDLAMPRLSGLEATRAIRQQVPEAKVLVLSAYHDLLTFQRALAAGASGFLSKHSAADELLTAIREVARGRTFYCSTIARKLQAQLRADFQAGRPGSGPAALSKRERQVLGLIGRGLHNKAMARHLELSVKTIEKHRQAVMDKLNIHDIAGLTRYAVSRGLVEVPAPRRTA